METCKTVSINLSGSNVNTDCCGCPTIEGTYLPSSSPYISYDTAWDDMLSFSPTQWIIPIKFNCGCSVVINPGSPIPVKTERYANIHAISVVGANPANVSFVYANGQTFCGSFPSHFNTSAYCKTITGWAMLVDKDPANVMQAKSSGAGGVTVSVQKCVDATPFQFQLKTELFFPDNFRRYSADPSGNCNNSSGSTYKYLLWQGAENIGGKNFINQTSSSLVSCNKSTATKFITPVVFTDSCVVTQSGVGPTYFQAFKTIQAIRVISVDDSWGVSAVYNGAQGLWEIHTDKNPNGTFHSNRTAPNTSLTAYATFEIDTLENNSPCSSLIDGNAAYTNAPIINTTTVTVALGEFSSTTTCPF